MKKLKRICISLILFWLACYIVMFLIMGSTLLLFTSGSSYGKPDIAQVKALENAFPSLTPTGSIFGNGKNNLLALIFWPVAPASVTTLLACLAVACGYAVTPVGYRPYPSR